LPETQRKEVVFGDGRREGTRLARYGNGEESSNRKISWGEEIKRKESDTIISLSSIYTSLLERVDVVSLEIQCQKQGHRGGGGQQFSE